jgi:hypothetical protein
VTTEELVRRFAFRRPDARLAGYEEVGLPFWRLRLKGFVLQRKPIDPIGEFILKAIHCGLQTEGELSGFLGLRGEALRGVLSELLRSEDIHLGAVEGGRRHTWALTTKGRKTLEDAETVVPEEQSFEVDFDGLLRCVAAPIHDDYAPKQLRDLGWLEIPPSPVKPPELGDLSFPEIARLLRSRIGRSREVLSITGVDRRTRLFRPAILLVYQSKATGGLDYGLVVDGKLSEEFGNAFARSGARERLNLDVPPEAEALEEIARCSLSEKLRERLPKASDVEATRELVAAAEERLARAKEEANQAATSAERQEAQRGITKAQKELASASSALTNLPVRHLAVFDHPPLLTEAMTQASERLLIVSPWISASVVTDEFLKRLEVLLRKGVQVYLGYGIGDDRDRRETKADKEVKEKLHGLAARRNNFRCKNFGNTHAKILAYDRAWCVATSFNWLSFRGDRSKGYRDEQGFLVTAPEFVDEAFNKQMPAFDVTDRT